MRFYHGRQLQPREYIQLGKDDDGIKGGKVLAVYPATEGLSFKIIRGIIDAHLDTLLPMVREYLPDDVLGLAGVPSLPEAIRMVHRPHTIAEGVQGRARLAFEELLFVHVLHRRGNALKRERRSGIAFQNRRELTSALKSALPFTLTNAQATAIREIVADMSSDRRMHRLLQGDVGAERRSSPGCFDCRDLENGTRQPSWRDRLLAEQPTRTIARLRSRSHRAILVPEASLMCAKAARQIGGRSLLVVGTHAS